MDGGGLDDRCRRDGDHHHRPSVDTGGIQYWRLHAAALWPESGFTRRLWTARPGTGPLGVLGNVLWLILAGWWLALGHLITAIMLAITIVGIPFAWAHVKLAGLALWPIGKMSLLRSPAQPA
jgi:uncharacterized membrane protein YccF (DUF307 family)